MKRTGLSRTVFAFLSGTLLFFFSCRQKIAEGLLIENIRIISGTGEQTDMPQFVWIKKGVIFSVTSKRPSAHFQEDSILDGTGKFLIPGLIDAHVHLFVIPGMNGRLANAHPALRDSFRTQLPKSYLYYGFTTLADLGERYGMERFLAAPVRPDIIHCDYPLTQANGYGMTFDTGPERYDDHPNFLWDDRQRADIPAKFNKTEHLPPALVEKVRKNGGSLVKVKYEDGFGGIFNWPNPAAETIRQVVQESHAMGLPVALHANSLRAYQFGLETGVDFFTHGLWHWGDLDNAPALPAEVRKILDRVIDSGIGVMPTMRVIQGERDFLAKNFLQDPALKNSVPAALLDWYRSEEGGWYEPELNELYESNAKLIARKFGYTRLQESKLPVIDVYVRQLETVVRYLSEKKARFLFGSDTPSGPSYANPAGYNGFLEMKQLVAAGLNLRQLFEALTINNARALHIQDAVGVIEPGKKAHLLILNRNPFESIEAYNTIETVIVRGVPYQRNNFKAN